MRRTRRKTLPPWWRRWNSTRTNWRSSRMTNSWPPRPSTIRVTRMMLVFFFFFNFLLKCLIFRSTSNFPARSPSIFGSWAAKIVSFFPKESKKYTLVLNFIFLFFCFTNIFSEWNDFSKIKINPFQASSPTLGPLLQAALCPVHPRLSTLTLRTPSICPGSIFLKYSDLHR